MKFASMPISIYATAGLIIGILWQYFTIGPHNHLPYAVAALTFAPLSWHIYARPYSSAIKYSTIIFLFFLIGAWRYSYQLNQIDIIWQSLNQKTCDLIGTIQDIAPTNIAHQKLYRINIIRRKEITTIAWIESNFTIYVYSKPVHSLYVGDTVQLNIIKFQPQTKSEYHQYLAKEGVVCSLFTNLYTSTVIYRPMYCFARWLHTIRNTLFTGIIAKMSKRTATLFSSLFLGQTKIDKEEGARWTELFRTWGLSHYLARSGLHLALFVYIWHLLLRFAPCSFLLKQLVLFLLTAIYAALSWPSISFYRAINTFALCTWITLHKRRTNFLHILALVCLTTLIYNPSNLLFLDFELSYGLTLALGWFNYLDKNNAKI